MSTLKVNAIQNTSGVLQKTLQASIYFTQVSTQAINSSVNISSITDDGVGLTTVNFSNSFANTNYLLLSGNSTGEGSSSNTDAYNLAPYTTLTTSAMSLQSKLRGLSHYDYYRCYAAWSDQ